MVDVEEASKLKTKLARAQLGTALSLFLRDLDPLSVHALTSGGRECISGVAQVNNIDTLTSVYIKSYPDKKGTVIRDHNRYWNSIKHFYQDPKTQTLRDDAEIMREFSDEVNDTYLWDGWLTYQRVVRQLPPEAQVFQVWWIALHPEVFAELTPAAESFFPKLTEDGRSEQKRRLRRACERYRRDPRILSDPRTETVPLVLGWP